MYPVAFMTRAARILSGCGLGAAILLATFFPTVTSTETASPGAVSVEVATGAAPIGVNISVGSVFTATCSPTSITAYFYGNATGGVPPYVFTWSFGDGSPTEVGQNTSHAYRIDGFYNVTLWATDAHGGNGTRTERVGLFAPCPPGHETSSPFPESLELGVVAVAAASGIVAFFGAYRLHRKGPRS